MEEIKLNGDAVIHMEKEENGFVNPLSNVDSEKLNSSDVTNFDQIEVSLVEDEGASEPDKVLINATDFFLEHNANYEVSWDEASRRICEVEDDPSKPPLPGCNVDYVRFRLRRVIESLYFRLFTMALIITDVIIVIIDLATSSGTFLQNLYFFSARNIEYLPETFPANNIKLLSLFKSWTK